MPDEDISCIIEQLHQTEGFPRLEIEGCKYPVDEKLIGYAHNCTASPPGESVCGFKVVRITGEKNPSSGLKWLEHDGFGGQVGSVNVPSEYLAYLDTRKGDRCAYVVKDKFDRQDYYHTEIDREYILFRKSDLVRVVEIALTSEDRTGAGKLQGKRVVDDVIWDDSFPTGPCAGGPKVSDVGILFCMDLSEKEPKYTIYQNPEQVLDYVLTNFQRYSRDGETLTLDGEDVRYDYIRDNQDPSYAGTLHDRKTFKKSALMELIRKVLSSTSQEASVTTNCFKEDFDDSESIFTGGKLGHGPSYATQVTLELKVVKNVPVLRTGDMLPWQYLKIE